MKLANYDNRNFGYVLFQDDKFELPIFVGDTLQEVADYLGISLSATSRLLSRNPDMRIKKRKLERVQLYDYVYIIYELDINHPIYVAQDINELAKKSKFSKTSIVDVLYNRRHPLQRKYKVVCIDLFEFNINYANYIKECLCEDVVTKSYEDYLELREC